MTPALKHWISATIGIVCGLVLVVPAAPTTSASASPPPGRQTITGYLVTHPGGVPINNNEISYGGGRFIVTLNPPSAYGFGVPDCPSGWYCFYDRVSYGYPRGRLSDCGVQDLATWGWQYRTESAHYNLSRGSTAFFYYGTWLFEVGVGGRALPDITPYRNWANRVVRYC